MRIADALLQALGRHRPPVLDWVTGGVDLQVARHHADAMVPVATTGDASYWRWHASRVLSVYLHAAALGGHGLNVVTRWVLDPDASAREVRGLLRRSRQAVFAVATLQDYVTANDRTRTAVQMTILASLERVSADGRKGYGQ